VRPLAVDLLALGLAALSHAPPLPRGIPLSLQEWVLLFAILGPRHGPALHAEGATVASSVEHSRGQLLAVRTVIAPRTPCQCVLVTEKSSCASAGGVLSQGVDVQLHCKLL
jgi:hypothetical protein